MYFDKQWCKDLDQVHGEVAKGIKNRLHVAQTLEDFRDGIWAETY
jgi:hypothetical protein